ncbi:MAG: ABC transporter permease [Acidobacteriota bacterium]
MAAGSLSPFFQDVRYAGRLLRRSPGFAAVAVATLALGIGATTAVLSFVDAILLHPLPYADPERLVVLLHGGENPVSPANYLDWKARARSFEAMGAAELWSANLAGATPPEKVWALRMTAEVLPMLGVRPETGRFFGPGELGDHVAVISDGLWRRRFGSDPAILGRTIPMNGEPYTIVGVMPPGFVFAPFWATRSEIWAPLDLRPRASNREGSSLRVFARLRARASVASARQEMASVAAELERQFPGTNRNVTVTGLREKVVGDVRAPLWQLLAAAVFVLLIACANVANMLLARASGRRREMALRAAIGASRARTVRQLLTESVVLAAFGGAAGALLGAWLLRVFVALAPEEIPRIADVRLSAPVLLAAFGAALLTGLVVGLAPALQTSSVALQTVLKEGGAAGAGREGRRLRDFFAAVEIAVALVLLVGAGLMARSLAALRRVDPGFDPRDVVSLEVSVVGTRHVEPERRAVLYRQLLERIRSVPGVRSAGAINHLPLAGDIWGWPFSIEGRPQPRPGESPVATYRAVMPGYFATMRQPVLRGRDVSDADAVDAPGVVVVNEWLARSHWPGVDPIGERITLDDPGPNRKWLTVIGVVKNAVRGEWTSPPEDEIYLSYLQTRQLLEGRGPAVAYITLVVRTDGDPAALAPSLRSAIWSIDPSLPVSAVQTMESVVALANGRARFQTLLLAAFALAAAALAAVGIYGVMSYAVSRRTREIGVRMALGASPAEVRRLVIGQGARVALAGGLAGLGAALVLTRWMAGVLYGVRPSDPPTYVAVAAALVGVALVASWLPARRAARLDPVAALRAE